MEKSTHAEREERILAYWNTDGTFQKSLKKDSPKGEFVFYDGPPFATGTPHYGHILAGTIKDAIPRYKTMQGYHVPRRWGWDCHGLPLENLIEKELGLKTKKDIEELGIEKFNAAARAAVLRYAHVWQELVPRFGRWVDMDHDYRTMDSSYTESVWWVFRTLHDKGLVYEGYKSMQLCPRCGTTLSNFEVNQGYKDITDISVYVKFEIKPNTFVLAWTTTPWTLPGNAALAVNPDITYVEIQIEKEKYILAKERLSVIKQEYKINREFSGKELVGTKYQPVFDFFLKESAIYAADFVTTTDGTGVVHIAPAFGSEDYELGQKNKLKFIQHVGTDGKFTNEVKGFEWLDVKPKDDHQRTDIEIIKYLAGKGTLFSKEKIIHSYPHCWRCETPLLNYAASSWFVRVADFKDKLVAENKKVDWVPSAVGENRFGKWLEGARDWAISRTRYWGAPLPVWKSKTETKIICSVDEIKENSKRSNKFFVMRHGETDGNIEGLVSCDMHSKDSLTEKGIAQIKKTAEALKSKKIDLIIASPFHRTTQTANIIKDILGIKKVIFDKRLVEIQAHAFQGKKWESLSQQYKNREEAFTKKIEGVELFSDVRARVGEALYEFNKTYTDKNILIISHGTPLRIMTALTQGEDNDVNVPAFTNAEYRELDFVPLPHDTSYALDFHRPYIDDIILIDSKGEAMQRVPDVFDCWFESGSMPYGEAKYKGMRTESFDPQGSFFRKTKGYPADFIAEGLDQTRGWFYSMLVLGTALFGKSPYKNVIVNGLVLAEDGKKMSKSQKNYPDPMEVVNKYGADAVRYFMLTSAVVSGEDLCFTEKGVDDVVKKVINRLDNVISFYEMYKKEGSHQKPTHILDLWIIERLQETISIVTQGMETYQLHVATRPINDFVEDLSTWYLRRSRDRFKDGDMGALSTIKTVLTDFAKVLAPFMPFFAEDMYMRMGQKESVHLASWPSIEKTDQKIITDMHTTRALVTLGLEARVRHSLKVRQPLAKLSIKNTELSPAFLELIKDEVNVKEVVSKKDLAEEVLLDTVITPELKEEGSVRELLRFLQDMRKEKGLSVGDAIMINVETDTKGQEFLNKYRSELLKVAQIKDIAYIENIGKEITLDSVFKITIA